MSEQSKDGGPAFPQNDLGGLTKREWFAGQALCSSPTHGHPGDISRRAYAIADAMLVARSTPPAKGE